MDIRTHDRSGCLFWGKAFTHSIEGRVTCLPLVDHALDVACVFQALCDVPALARATEHAACRRLDTKDIARLCVLVMLHDLGKFNLGFQYKIFPDPPLPPAGHVRELEALFQNEDLRDRLAEALQIEELAGWFADDGCELESYLFAIWSHHGRPIRFDGQTSSHTAAWKRLWQPHHGHDPLAGVAELMRVARGAFPAAFTAAPHPLPNTSAFQHLFAGLVMLADWLGSHTHWFPVDEPMTTDERIRHARSAAAEQLKAVGLDTRHIRQATPPLDGFPDRFGFGARPLQAAVHELTAEAPASHLLIAESETGSGKTEAALDRFLTLFTAGTVDGLYFALPTRVAARELYERVRKCMEKWFPDPATRPVTVLAVPGYPQVDGIPPEHLPPDESHGRRWQDDDAQHTRERAWAIEHPKRFLAATVAVGTIDQALLAAIQTSHAHLRGACLTRSLLVVDEVHASDRYMSRLLEHLLTRHLHLGGHALLLSATLGSVARSRYLAVARGDAPARAEYPPLETSCDMAYPALSLADGTLRSCAGERQQKRVQVSLLPCAETPGSEIVIEHIVGALQKGARILVVLNTVSRANGLHRALEAFPDLQRKWLFRCKGIAAPHHSRFAPSDRVCLDAAVSRHLGRDGPDGPVVLVGTQTLEQSLDIDADLLITDLAPADVLLQRIGRLHRHARERPSGSETARCLVLVPEPGLLPLLDGRGEANGTAKRMGYGSVYEDLRTLELTRRSLEATSELHIPRDNRRLVEHATHPEALAVLETENERWQAHTRMVEGGNLARGVQAAYALLDFEQCFGELAFNETGQQLATRLGVAALQLPLSETVTSPFGQCLREMTIPGHLAPQRPEEIVTVTEATADGLRLRCADRHYRYTRHGLEPEENL